MVERTHFERETIYEKTFPKETLDEIRESMIERGIPVEAETKLHMTHEEVMAEIYKGVEYVFLPERVKTADAFVKTAVELSELYELDVKIVKHPNMISVNYYFNSSGCMGFLREIFLLADDIAFFANIKGYDIVVSIDHYTHAVMRNGKRIKP